MIDQPLRQVHSQRDCKSGMTGGFSVLQIRE
jgi:hypothetical protein